MEESERITRLEGRMTVMESKFRRLTDGVDTNNRMTSEMYESFSAVKGGFTVLTFIGKVARPITFSAALVAAIYVLLTTGKWPHP